MGVALDYHHEAHDTQEQVSKIFPFPLFGALELYLYCTPAVMYQIWHNSSSKEMFIFIKNTSFLKHADHNHNLQNAVVSFAFEESGIGEEGDRLIMAVAERESGYGNEKYSAVKFNVIDFFVTDFFALQLYLKTYCLQKNFF